MAVYNPGDRVVIRTDLKRDERYAMFDDPEVLDSVNSAMMSLAGCVCTITGFRSNGKYAIDKDGGRWFWTDEMFEGLVQELPDIHINVNIKSLMD